MLRQLIKNKSLLSVAPSYTLINKLPFSTTTSQESNHYLPVKKYDFDQDNTTKIQIFKQPATKSTTRSIPYQIKQTVFKNFLIVVTSGGLDLMMHGIAPYLITATAFNLTYRLFHYTTKMVTQIDLMKNGKEVSFKTLMGQRKTVKIQDIQKQQNEKVLVETWEQPFLYPVKVKNSLYYLYGQGQETIRDGELFRAVINGKNIKFQ